MKDTTNVISGVEQISTGWLTRVLTESNALKRGAVVAFDVESGSGNWSENVRLRLRYTDDAQGECPERLFLKMVNTDLGDGEYFGPSEVAYYVQDYVDVEEAPLLRCYDARFSPAQQRYHVLLEDVTETHVRAYEKELTPAYGRALVEGFAALHARWWGAERLADAGMPIHESAFIHRFVAIAEPGAANVIAHLSDELEPHWPAAIRDLFARHPGAMIERTERSAGFTIIHGDPGAANILVPRAGVRPLYLIDRQPFDWSLTTWLGIYDLAYAIFSDWDIAFRRTHERALLRHYLAELQRHGVRGYGWEQLWDDYRLALGMGVYIAVEYCRGGIGGKYQWYWLQMLGRALTACDDLDCYALWS